jgi:hypothetical protein
MRRETMKPTKSVRTDRMDEDVIFTGLVSRNQDIWKRPITRPDAWIITCPARKPNALLPEINKSLGWQGSPWPQGSTASAHLGVPFASKAPLVRKGTRDRP